MWFRKSTWKNFNMLFARGELRLPGKLESGAYFEERTGIEPLRWTTYTQGVRQDELDCAMPRHAPNILWNIVRLREEAAKQAIEVTKANTADTGAVSLWTPGAAQASLSKPSGGSTLMSANMLAQGSHRVRIQRLIRKSVRVLRCCWSVLKRSTTKRLRRITFARLGKYQRHRSDSGSSSFDAISRRAHRK